MQNIDSKFFDRADAHINLSNEQIDKKINAGKVSASMMYATARFNAWLSSMGWSSSEELALSKKETIEFFVNEYTEMLEENFDDYIDNFDKYLATNS